MKKHLAVAIAFGAVFALTALSARAEIQTAELRVNGLTCPFCAFGIEKKLFQVDGVSEVEVLLDVGLLRLSFSAGNEATVQDLEDAVDDSGFRLAGLRLAARGTLRRDGDEETFEVGPRERFRLVEKRDGSADPLTAETRERLRSAAAGGTVLIRGEVGRNGGGLRALSVEHLAPAEPRRE